MSPSRTGCDEDFHHALDVLLTRERCMRHGTPGHAELLARAFREAFAPAGHPPMSERREVTRERSGRFAQTVLSPPGQDADSGHDTSRAASVGPDELTVAVAAVAFSPFLPLLFMAERYGQTAPFLYFVSPRDPTVLRAVCDGRGTFGQGRLGWPSHDDARDRWWKGGSAQAAPAAWTIDAAYRDLLRLRRERPALATTTGSPGTGSSAVALEDARAVVVRRWAAGDELALVLAFDGYTTIPAPLPDGRWCTLFDSARRWAHPDPELDETTESNGVVVLTTTRPRAVLLARHGS